MSKRRLDISNYEAWLLDHMEERLDSKESAELEEFLLSHPELNEDLDLLSDISLNPIDLKHPEKGSLKMPEEHDLLAIKALESGSDGSELSGEDLKEFKRYQKTVLLANERIIFPNKGTLKKKESTPIVPMWLTRIAIAASLIGIVLTILFQTRPDNYEPRLSDADLPSFDIESPVEAESNYAASIDVNGPEGSLPIQDEVIRELAQEEGDPSGVIDPKPVPLYSLEEGLANELAQETELDIEEVPNELDSPDVEIVQNPIPVEDAPLIQDEILIADLPKIHSLEEDPQVAEVPDMGTKNNELDYMSNSQRFGSVLDVLKHATRDSELLALQDAKGESAYVETSLKVGRFQLAVKRKKRN